MPFSENEVPTGTINSVTGSDGNNLFGLAFPPSDPTRVKLYSGGVRVTSGIHFTLSGQQITFLAGYYPLAGDTLIADYPWEFPVGPPATPSPLTPSSIPGVAVNFSDPLGVDVSCYPGLDPLGSYVSGLPALCQRIARRLTTPRGAWVWAPNECTDVRAYLNESMTADTQAQIKSAIEREAQREECVATASADVSFNPQTFTLTAHLTGTTAIGPFQFILGINKLTAAIMKAG